MSQPHVTPEVVTLLAKVADLPVPESSRLSLARALEEHLIAIRRFALPASTEVQPELTFDPRWDTSK